MQPESSMSRAASVTEAKRIRIHSQIKESNSMKDGLNLTHELARLMDFVASVATAIRMNTPYSSAYVKGNDQHVKDVMWLADSLHNLNFLGHAIRSGEKGVIISACEMLDSIYAQYNVPSEKNTGIRDSKGTFDRYKEYFSLEEARAILGDIRAKLA